MTKIIRRQPDEEFRLSAASHIAGQFERNARLVERCEQLSRARKADHIGALKAAALIMHSEAALIGMLARVAQIETRHRSFVEGFQAAKQKSAELNSKTETPQELREKRRKIMLQMDRLVRDAIRKRTGDPNAEDMIDYNLKRLDREDEEDRKKALRDHQAEEETEQQWLLRQLRESREAANGKPGRAEGQ